MTTIKIPNNIVDQVRSFMNDLSIDSKNISHEIKDTEYCDVKEILNSKSNSPSDWTFQIMFSDKSVQWVADKDCNCETLISQYLEEVGINTAHLLCRVSSLKQANARSTSLQTQQIELEKSQALFNFDRIKIHKINKSAYKSIPQYLVDLGENLKEGDGLFVWKIDRLSRNIVRYLSWLEDLSDRGVIIYSHMENIYYKNNKTQFLQYLLNAQKEAEELGNRIKMSYKRKRERGDEAIGSLPYGQKYKRIKIGEIVRNVVINHSYEQKLINMICSSKSSDQELAEKMNVEGKLKRGKKWNKGMVRRIRKSKLIKRKNI
jgi:DNA invertase Pin-like site-specific DNA recombinase